MSNIYKLGLWGANGKLEAINGRLIFTPSDKKIESFTTKFDDIETIDIQKKSRINYVLRIITKQDKIYTIENLASDVSEKAKEWMLSQQESMINEEKSKDGSSEKMNKTQKVSNSDKVPVKEKKEPTEEDKIGGDNLIMRVVVIILFLIGSNSLSVFLLLIFAPFYGIWARKTVATKELKFIDRIKNFKSYKGRVITSIFFLLFALLMVFSKLEIILENKPIINVSGGEIQDIGSKTGYDLTINIENTKELQINDQSVIISGKIYNQVFDLTNLTGLIISIKARNTEKELSKEIRITRSLTNEELISIEQTKKEQEKLIAEQKKQEEENQKKEEAYKKSPEYKTKIQKERLDEIISKQEFSLISTCKKGVKSLLKSPSTADFPSFDFKFFVLGNQIIIKSYVDSQNGFGAQIRSDFICYYTLGDDNNVTLTDIKFD